MKTACERSNQGLSDILTMWRQVSPGLPLLWNDSVDRRLIRSLLSGDDQSAALEAFAKSVADTGGHLTECCDHLCALVSVLDNLKPNRAHATPSWNLVPTLVECFYVDPQLWGFDPVTGCVSGSFLSVAMNEYYRRARSDARPERWSLVAVKLHRTKDLASAVIAEITTGLVLARAVPDVEVIAHVRPGAFAILSVTDDVGRDALSVREALNTAHVAGEVAVHQLPPTLRQCRELVTSLSPIR
jgi:hypothetical protein